MISSGKQISEARIRLGWTRADLGRAAVVDRKTVAYWESRPTIDANGGGAGHQSLGVECIERALRRAGIRFPEPPAPKPVKMPKPQHDDMLIRNSQPPRRTKPKLVRRLDRALEVEPSQRTQSPHWRVVHGVECGARTRKGTPCRRPAYPNGRCRNHGGLCTGPRTPEGRARSAAGAQRGRESQRARRLVRADIIPLRNTREGAPVMG
jgi:hypothetical protein